MFLYIYFLLLKKKRKKLEKTTAGTDACTEGTGALSLVTALGLAIHKITSNQEDITV